MYGQPSLRKTNAGWDREAFIAGARYRALNSEARSRELGAFVCVVGDKRSWIVHNFLVTNEDLCILSRISQKSLYEKFNRTNEKF